jgi:glutaconate CoA-transferase subunit A
MPALNLDVALLHVNKSDQKGNTQIFGPDPFFDEMFARAANKTYVSAEEVVETEGLGGKEGAIFNRFERSLVTGVTHAPGGAHPTSCAPNYGFDMEHLKTYSAAAKSFEDYNDKYLNISHTDYIEAVGGETFVNNIPLPQF